MIVNLCLTVGRLQRRLWRLVSGIPFVLRAEKQAIAHCVSMEMANEELLPIDEVDEDELVDSMYRALKQPLVNIPENLVTPTPGNPGMGKVRIGGLICCARKSGQGYVLSPLGVINGILAKDNKSLLLFKANPETVCCYVEEACRYGGEPLGSFPPRLRKER